MLRPPPAAAGRRRRPPPAAAARRKAQRDPGMIPALSSRDLRNHGRPRGLCKTWRLSQGVRLKPGKRTGGGLGDDMVR